MQSATFNKATAFTMEEREAYGLRGLLPPKVDTIEEQCQRVLIQFNSFKTNLEKYTYLQILVHENETLFYYFLTHNLKSTLPIVYTPTVGEACLNFSHNFRVAQGNTLNENIYYIFIII